MGQKVKEILKKQNKGGKTGTLKSRKKHFLVKFQANRMGKEVKEIQKKLNKGVKSGRGVAENIWRGNR